MTDVERAAVRTWEECQGRLNRGWHEGGWTDPAAKAKGLLRSLESQRAAWAGSDPEARAAAYRAGRARNDDADSMLAWLTGNAGTS